MIFYIAQKIFNEGAECEKWDLKEAVSTSIGYNVILSTGTDIQQYQADLFPLLNSYVRKKREKKSEIIGFLAKTC